MAETKPSSYLEARTQDLETQIDSSSAVRLKPRREFQQGAGLGQGPLQRRCLCTHRLLSALTLASQLPGIHLRESRICHTCVLRDRKDPAQASK
jgi:hypothetical protein